MKPGKKKPPVRGRGSGILRLDNSDDSAIRPGDKKLKEINRQYREFWEAESKTLKSLIKRWPDFAQLAATKIECDALVHGIRSANSIEYEVSKLFKQLGLVVKLTKREQKIWSVIQQGVEGPTYCREVHRAGVKPRKSWLDDDCPSTYPEAYREGEPWRKRIQDEKCRIKNKAELAQLVDP
jgi:hypothetical protein